jgi:ATP-dependent DNA helicase RecG
MKLKELKNLVADGENERVEFKATTGQRTQAGKTVCGLLNNLGGFVVFGVTDKGDIVGQMVAVGTLESIASELLKIEPPAFPDIATVPF